MKKCQTQLVGGVDIGTPSIMDIAPTSLFLLNEPIPAGMDGRVLEECFQIPRERLVAGCMPMAEQEAHRSALALDQESYTEQERRIMTDQLRALGYLD